MGRYVFELDKDRVYEILKENTLFFVAFNDFPEWKEIIEEWDFEKIWNVLLDNTFLQKGLLYSTQNEVVFFLGSQVNPKKEQRETICDRMGFSPHGNEIPVFLLIPAYLQIEEMELCLLQKESIENIKAPSCIR